MFLHAFCLYLLFTSFHVLIVLLSLSGSWMNLWCQTSSFQMFLFSPPPPFKNNIKLLIKISSHVDLNWTLDLTSSHCSVTSREVSLHVVTLRLQVPRAALRRRLSVLSGAASRPVPWRRRPIAFLCYVLSVGALRPLAKRVRAVACWLLIGQREKGRDRNYHISFFFSLFYLVSCFLLLSPSSSFSFWFSSLLLSH